MPIFREDFATNRRNMDSFIGIRFKKETAKRFQTFSRTYFKSHTEAMATMLDFFFYNEISPKEKYGKDIMNYATKHNTNLDKMLDEEALRNLYSYKYIFNI